MSTRTSSRQSKLHKKVKLPTRRSKTPGDDGGTLDAKKKGFGGRKKAQISANDDFDVRYGDNKLYKKDNSGRRNEKTKAKSKSGYEQEVDGHRGSKLRRNDHQRKRVYADRDESTKGMFHKNVDKPTRKDLPKGQTRIKDDFAKEKRTAGGKLHELEQLGKEMDLKWGRKSRDAESLDRNDGKELRRKPKAEGKIQAVKMDHGENSSVKKDAKGKSVSRKQLEQTHNVRVAKSLGKSVKKKINDKKSVGNDLEENDDRPKKRKRVIRIDPHDITNKRLDDGAVSIGHTKEDKEDMEKNSSAEMSKNAQFRAIKPSPSILSFVEDNFLGRRRLIELRRAGYNTELSAPLDNIPFSTSSERERIEESIFRNKLTFFAAANVSSSFPSPDLPEIAFAGRSNVGKSSLLNSLTRQWGVVRTSDKPGLTQTINFFKLGSKLCLVDLPGYGFAYAKEEVKEAWEELVKEYVSTRVGLKQVCLLIDTKWGMKPRDRELIDLMERSHTKYQIVLTKTDLVFPIDVARRAMQIEESLKAKKSAIPPVMMVSSKSGAGIRSLRTVLAKIARFAKL